jgi:hypothetical protein
VLQQLRLAASVLAPFEQLGLIVTQTPLRLRYAHARRKRKNSNRHASIPRDIFYSVLRTVLAASAFRF